MLLPLVRLALRASWPGLCLDFSEALQRVSRLPAPPGSTDLPQRYLRGGSALRAGPNCTPWGPRTQSGKTTSPPCEIPDGALQSGPGPPSRDVPGAPAWGEPLPAGQKGPQSPPTGPHAVVTPRGVEPRLPDRKSDVLDRWTMGPSLTGR
jgi:hypothetical protein